MIRKLVQNGPDLIAMPRLDGRCDVKHVAGLDAGTPEPDLLGDDFRNGFQEDFLSENFP